MLTREQILKVSRLVNQTGENEGFYEPNFDNFDRQKRRALKPQEGKHTVKLSVVCVELPNGDVVLQKR